MDEDQRETEREREKRKEERGDKKRRRRRSEEKKGLKRKGAKGEREHAELAERVPGDAYHSYLDKCIKTTLEPPVGNIELTVRLGLRSQDTPRFLAPRFL